MPLDDSQIVARRGSAFRLGGTSDRGAGVAAGGTMKLSGDVPISAFTGGPPSSQRSSEDSMAKTAVKLALAMDELRKVYQEYEAALTKLEQRTQAALEAAGNPVTR